MPDISLCNVNKYFGDVCRLKNINLDITSGESCVIIGGSGSGKSLLIKLMVGLIKSSTGSIKIGGEEVVDITEKKLAMLREKISFLFQGNALFDSFPVWKNIVFKFLYNRKFNKNQLRDKALHYLQKVDLNADVMNLLPSKLSGGMQKRVAIARALVSEPELIFFDEPTSGLDVINAARINDLILYCNQELKITTVTITHDLSSAYKLAKSQIIVLDKGNLLFSGPKDALWRSENEYIKKLLSFHQKN